ncbi:MAG: DUF45 domain-containing protein [Methanomassiliicoccaceae archaeon]|nr:DUF45 domain-containing protein [Methanomassiliicoccaceae archaeon]
MKKDDERLFDIFSEMAASRNIMIESTSFYPFKEFQAAWRRPDDKLIVRVSDYLIDAPDDVLRDFSKTVIGTIEKKRPSYGKTYLDWVRRDEFVKEKRKIYLRRSRNLTGEPVGNERCITDSIEKMVDSSLLDADSIQNSVFSWTKNPNIRKFGYCSPMMRVVGVSCILDDLNVPEYVFDYVVYHESLHLMQGYNPGHRAHSKEFRECERLFPNYEKAESYLKTLADGRVK